MNCILCTVDEDQNYAAIQELSALFSVLCCTAGASLPPESGLLLGVSIPGLHLLWWLANASAWKRCWLCTLKG